MWWLVDISTQARLAEMPAPTLEQQAQFEAAAAPPPTGVRGARAVIQVAGLLTRKPSFIAMLFGSGNTTYGDIVTQVRAAEANPEVEEIEYRYNSPGGTVDGLFDAIGAMQLSKKPSVAVVEGMAASAAYALASQADRIVATSPGTQVGSLGVVARYFISDSVVTITSDKAPNKAPDVTTDAGKKVVREELNALHDIFVDAIAAGRNTTVNKVNQEFGQGGIVLAEEAVTRGMIDAMQTPTLTVVKPTAAVKSGENVEKQTMDLNQLRAEHPAVYADAVEQGRQAERDRVCAHLTMGETSGDMKTAVGAVRDGSEMTQSLQATYMAAAMKSSMVAARAADDDLGAGTGAGGVAAGADDKDGTEKVLCLVEDKLGMATEVH